MELSWDGGEEEKFVCRVTTELGQFHIHLSTAPYNVPAFGHKLHRSPATIIVITKTAVVVGELGQ